MIALATAPRDELRKLAREVLARGGVRRRPRAAWVVRLAGALLGGADRVRVDSTLEGAGYFCSVPFEHIVVSPNTDVAFTIAHEIGHWTFKHLRPAYAFPNVPHDVEERSANAFAEVLLGRAEKEVA